MTTTVTNTTKSSKHMQEAKYSRRRTKSPSESSMDSSADVFDSELRQKYMRAVAYLRILDETPLFENDENEGGEFVTSETTTTIRHNQQQQNQRSTSRSDAIDIDLVIEQARNIAYLNEKTNPERSQRILEKVHKLEQRWAATKSKRDSLKTSSKLYEQYKKREGNLTDQIHILEKHFATYQVDDAVDERIIEDDWVCVFCLFVGILLRGKFFFQIFST